VHASYKYQIPGNLVLQVFLLIVFMLNNVSDCDIFFNNCNDKFILSLANFLICLINLELQ